MRALELKTTGRRLTITAKIICSVAVMLSITLISSFLALRAIDGLGQTVNAMARRTAIKLALAERIRAVAYQARFASRGVSLGLFEKLPRDVVKAKQSFQSSGEQIQQIVNDLRPLLQTEAEQKALNNLQALLPGWESLRQEMFRLAAAGDTEALSKLRNAEVRKTAEAVDMCAAALIELENKAMADAAADSQSSATRAFALQLLFIAVTVTAGGIVIMIIWRLGRVLAELAGHLRRSADRMANMSAQIGSQGESLAQASTEQAAAAEQTSAAAEEATVITRQSQEYTRTAANLMCEVDQATQAGTIALQEMISSMTLISQSSDGISRILKVIDEIAFQTNILALNAAVEAARAGEAGMSFAVVADEVRNLAGRCGEATKDTAKLIEESIARSRDGSEKLRKLSDLVHVIVARSKEVKGLVEQVQAAGQQHSIGIEQIAKAVTQIGLTTQQTAAGAEESATSGEEMTAQAQSLRGEAHRLEMLVGAE